MSEEKYRTYLETLSLSELTQILRTIDRDSQSERYLLVKERYEALKALKGNERASAEPQRYQTALRRFAAAVVDMLVVFGLNWIAGLWLSSLIEMEPMRIQMLLTFSPALYAIVLIAVYGQTIGKFFLHVKVVSIEGDEPVTWKQSFIRGIVPVLLALIVALTWGLDGDLEVAVSWTILMHTSWLVADCLPILFNKKGQALHDFLAGTVVIRFHADV